MPKISPEQSNTIARTLYEPTIRRMNVLCQSLISTTANGDFALWAPLAVMEAMLSDLRWADARSPQRFLALIALTLRRYAEKIEVHHLAVTAAMEAGVPIPAFAAWGDQDTIAIYDEVDARFPEPAPVAEPVDPASNTQPGPSEPPAEGGAQ